MNPTQFLQIGGITLALISILGFTGAIGPTASESIFGDFWWFDSAENWTHLLLGIAAIAAAFVLPVNLRKSLVLAVGIVGIFFGLYSLLYSETFWGANLENPADSILHLAVGAWALWAGLKKEQTPMTAQTM